MVAGMLQLPISAVLLTTLFLGTDGVATMPLTIIAVVTSFVLSKWLAGPPSQPAEGEQPAEDTGASAVPPQQRAATDTPSPSRREASSG
jgi:predicted lipid-binding transport protein (Tim44 family)